MQFFFFENMSCIVIFCQRLILKIVKVKVLMVISNFIILFGVVIKK